MDQNERSSVAIVCVMIAAFYLLAYAFLIYNVIVFVIGQQRYKAQSKLLTLFYLNSFMLLSFQVVQYFNMVFNFEHWRITLAFSSAAAIMMLNTGIIMVLMM